MLIQVHHQPSPPTMPANIDVPQLINTAFPPLDFTPFTIHVYTTNYDNIKQPTNFHCIPVPESSIDGAIFKALQ